MNWVASVCLCALATAVSANPPTEQVLDLLETRLHETHRGAVHVTYEHSVFSNGGGPVAHPPRYLSGFDFSTGAWYNVHGSGASAWLPGKGRGGSKDLRVESWVWKPPEEGPRYTHSLGSCIPGALLHDILRFRSRVVYARVDHAGVIRIRVEAPAGVLHWENPPEGVQTLALECEIAPDGRVTRLKGFQQTEFEELVYQPNIAPPVLAVHRGLPEVTFVSAESDPNLARFEPASFLAAAREAGAGRKATMMVAPKGDPAVLGIKPPPDAEPPGGGWAWRLTVAGAVVALVAVAVKLRGARG